MGTSIKGERLIFVDLKLTIHLTYSFEIHISFCASFVVPGAYELVEHLDIWVVKWLGVDGLPSGGIPCRT